LRKLSEEAPDMHAWNAKNDKKVNVPIQFLGILSVYSGPFFTLLGKDPIMHPKCFRSGSLSSRASRDLSDVCYSGVSSFSPEAPVGSRVPSCPIGADLNILTKSFSKFLEKKEVKT